LHKQLLRAPDSESPQDSNSTRTGFQSQLPQRDTGTAGNARSAISHGTTCTKQQFETGTGTIHLNPRREQMRGKSTRNCKEEFGSYRDDVGVAEAEEEHDLRGELALELGGEGGVLLGLTDHLDGHLAAGVPARVHAAVAARGELAPDLQLGQVGAPQLLAAAPDPGARRRHQVLGPRHRLLVIAQRQPPLQPPPRPPTIAAALFETPQALHLRGRRLQPRPSNPTQTDRGVCTNRTVLEI
jgi:hypothetical protein